MRKKSEIHGTHGIESEAYSLARMRHDKAERCCCRFNRNGTFSVLYPITYEYCHYQMSIRDPSWRHE